MLWFTTFLRLLHPSIPPSSIHNPHPFLNLSNAVFHTTTTLTPQPLRHHNYNKTHSRLTLALSVQSQGKAVPTCSILLSETRTLCSRAHKHCGTNPLGQWREAQESRWSLPWPMPHLTPGSINAPREQTNHWPLLSVCQAAPVCQAITVSQSTSCQTNRLIHLSELCWPQADQVVQRVNAARGLLACRLQQHMHITFQYRTYICTAFLLLPFPSIPSTLGSTWTHLLVWWKREAATMPRSSIFLSLNLSLYFPGVSGTLVHPEVIKIASGELRCSG